MNRIPTREALGDEILQLGKENSDIFVIDCDVSKSCKTQPFSKELPLQHINVGIAEQNAVGVAAGLATTGKIPFVVTYAVFGSMRALEQVRQEVCYPNLNVKMLCSHGGLTPANDGGSHQCIEDLGIMRTIPNMTVIMAADYNSARKLIREAANTYGPVYMRFTRDGVDEIYDKDTKFEIGKANYLYKGKDATIIANGDTVAIAKKATEKLKSEGINVTLLDMHTIKPLDRKAVEKAIFETNTIITVEDHNIINGLGSAVSEVIAEVGSGQIRRVGVNDRFGESAPYERLLEMNNIAVEAICEHVKELVETKAVF
ncbi:transketolase family protein [Enterococcus sp. DIV0187]|uniref:transketolase family protein n=1 Tax=Enterococcus sp. DIV0187 TaxID=2774644 RepID=UPI003F26D4C1